MSATWSDLNIFIPEKASPVVEIDTEAGAAYIRFSNEPIFKTLLLRDDEIVATVDIDSKGVPVGIEVVGTTEFTLDKLLEDAGIPHYSVGKASREYLRYVRA
jgi:uncharacterized protein YuzE